MLGGRSITEPARRPRDSAEVRYFNGREVTSRKHHWRLYMCRRWMYIWGINLQCEIKMVSYVMFQIIFICLTILFVCVFWWFYYVIYGISTILRRLQSWKRSSRHTMFFCCTHLFKSECTFHFRFIIFISCFYYNNLYNHKNFDMFTPLKSRKNILNLTPVCHFCYIWPNFNFPKRKFLFFL